MAIRENIIALLAATPGVTGIVGSRYYTMRAPQDSPVPYLLISMPTALSFPDLEGFSDLTKGQIRFDLFGTSYPQLTTLRENLIDMMASPELGSPPVSPFSAQPGLQAELFEDETRYFHLIVDFSVMYYRSNT